MKIHQKHIENDSKHFSYTWIKFELPKIIFIVFLVCIVYSFKRKLIQWKLLYSLFKKVQDVNNTVQDANWQPS